MNPRQNFFTERIESANALARAKRKLEIAGTSAKLGARRYEVTANRLQWSTEAAHIHDEPDGFSPKVSDAIAYYAPEHRDRIATLFQASIDHGQPFEEKLQIITAKGRRIWVRATGEADRDENGEIIAVQGSFQDITELMTAQRKSEELGQRLAETLENMGDAFYTVDWGWRFTYVNNQAEKLIERERENLIGRPVNVEFSEYSGSVFESQFGRALDAK